MLHGERRTAIRAQVVAQIQEVYKGLVTSDRRVDARDLKEFVHVRLVAGEQESSGLETIVRSSLEITIHKTGIVSDDELDAISDIVEQSLYGDTSLNNNAQGIMGNGYDFQPDEEDQFSMLVLSYTIVHK